MQTFLPYPRFDRSARVLDDRRLGKQRVEALQIARALWLEDYGWQRHPAVCMWRGFTDALVAYGEAVVDEWTRRGYRDTVRPQLAEFATERPAPAQDTLVERGRMPSWLGRQDFHRSHQSALVRRLPSHYRRYFPDVPGDLPYVWPAPADASAAEPEPFTSWVVVPGRPAMLRRFERDSVVALPAPARLPSGRLGKAHRRVAAFAELAREGDPVVVPAGDELLVGELAGPHRRVPRSRTPHVRAVEWLGRIPRRALARPGRLQDPSAFFALRGEPDPRSLLRKAR